MTAARHRCLNLFRTAILSIAVLIAFHGVAKAEAYAPVVEELRQMHLRDPALIDRMLRNATTPPANVCSPHPTDGQPYCWAQKTADDLFQFFQSWLTSIPTPEQDGFGYYVLFYDLCTNNSAALDFVTTDPWMTWTKDFVDARGAVLDAPVDPAIIDQWKAAIGADWDDFVVPENGFSSFNDFFIRELKANKRPVTEGEDIVVAPADSIINYVHNDLTADTQLPTKYGERLNLTELLDGSSYSEKFIGGSAINAVLMPDVYHHYHAPVEGRIVESRQVDGAFFGAGGKFYEFFNFGNPGGFKAPFSYFGTYHRGYFVIETQRFGYVAVIPVGLDDVNSIQFEEGFNDIPARNPPQPIAKGQRLGHFAYGGSTVLMLFQKGVIANVSVQQGNRIGKLSPVR